MVFGARAEWGGVLVVHVAPVTGADVVAALRACGVTDDLWLIGPRRGEAVSAELGSLSRRRAMDLVQGAPPADACLVADPSHALAGALGVALSSDRHATLYGRDPALLARALGAMLGRRLALTGPLPEGSLQALLVPSEDRWFDARVDRTERLQVLRVFDVDEGEEAARFVRSRTVGWRSGLSW